MEFFAAVGTVGAVVVAYRLLRREAGRDEERAQERRAEQASLVAAWIRLTGVKTSTWELGKRQPEDYEVVQLNSSAAPVYDVRLIYRLVDAEGVPIGLGSADAPILPPGESTLVLPPDVVQKWTSRAATHLTLAVDIEFTDAVGRRWHRNHDGVLTDRTDT